jgi:hypothetical protein
MSPVLILSVLLQIGFAVHVIRTGRPMYWVLILLIGSYIAVAIYFFAEVLPDLHNSRGGRRAVGSLHDRIDPERRKRLASRQLDLVDTPENRRRLAEQSLLTGDYQHAMEQYRSALKGLYRADPDLMLGLAKAQFALNLPRESKQTLDELIAANPSYKSSEGHLLYARSVEATGDVAGALHEYETLAASFPGEEGRVRYGLLLKRSGDRNRANGIFNETLIRAAALPKYYQREQREWIEIAKREIE